MITHPKKMVQNVVFIFFIGTNKHSTQNQNVAAAALQIETYRRHHILQMPWDSDQWRPGLKEDQIYPNIMRAIIS